MKNCIVFSGQFRTFKDTVENIKEFIRINDLDVYCFLWTTDADEKRFVVDNLKPINFRFDDYSNYQGMFEEMEQRIRHNNPKPAPIDKVAANASMNFARKQAYSLVRNNYDKIFYCRYDIDIYEQFTLKEQVDFVVTPLEESYNLISDIFAIIPQKYAKHYFLYDEYENIHSTKFEPKFEEWLRSIKKYGEENIRIHRDDRYCPHMMLLRNLWNNNVPFVIENLPVRIKR
jgi:hypothetical protein